MGSVRFSIDPKLVRHLVDELKLTTFVETGTHKGDTVRSVLDMFDEIHTIEIADGLYGAAVEMFEDEPKVHLHHGSSVDVLSEILPKQSVLYWLDAHPCDTTLTGVDQCPLLEELRLIGSLDENSVVMIDDAGLFEAQLATRPGVYGRWPHMGEVAKGLRSLSDKHRLFVVDDVIVFCPRKLP